MTIRFGEYKKRDISFLLNFVANPFLYYTGYRWWTVNANFFRNKQHSFLKSRRFLWKKRIVTWLFEGKQDIIGNKSIHQVYAFIKSKRKKRKNRKKKSEKKRNSQNAGLKKSLCCLSLNEVCLKVISTVCGVLTIRGKETDP